MRIGTRIIVVAALAALTTLSFGQRGFGFGFGGGGAAPAAALLGRNDVKNDLKLTDEQKTKLQDLQEGMRSKMRDLFQSDGQDRDKLQADMKPIMDDMTKQANAILTPDQQTRLQEIRVQLAGNSAAASIPEVATALKLNDDQKTKIASLQKTQQDANAAIGEKMRNQEIDFPTARQTFQKNQDALNTEIGKVLTDDQKATLKKLGGATFTPDPPPGG